MNMAHLVTAESPERARARWPRRLRHGRGQAMLEYSAIVFFLALTAGVSILTLLPMLMNALNRYLQGIYFVLNLAIP